MTSSYSEHARRFYAETYDATGVGWDDELPFYLDLVAESTSEPVRVLELGCGTGRIAIPLAETGAEVTGLDNSHYMLDVARRKSNELSNLRWFEGDMGSFQLDQTFDTILIPGHAFQNLHLLEQQLACLNAARRHLIPNGLLVVHLDHLDPAWLGTIAGDEAGVFHPGGEFIHPTTGHTIRTLHAWSYDRATQTATLETIWDVASEREKVEERLESGPTHFHCFFPSEMMHLLNRCGFGPEAVYGDFQRKELTRESSEMIWIAKPSH